MQTGVAPTGDLTLDGDEFAEFLDVIYRDYHHDFRHYAAASLRRRVSYAMRRLRCRSLSELRTWLTASSGRMTDLLQYLTVSVTEMFRDPAYFLAVREHVMPVLQNTVSPKIWVAGCSTGEEAWSMAILLREAGLLERSLVYATDINPLALIQAERGIFSTEKIRLYTENYQRAGGTTAFSDYYLAAYGNAVFDRSLRRHIVFAEHSLATDHVFSEMNFVSCRNVLIYFNSHLQEHAMSLFVDSLSPRGFIGLGSRESLSFSGHASTFDPFLKAARIYRKKDEFQRYPDHVSEAEYDGDSGENIVGR
ncbi:MAG: protein-glutamate O-methyltransferase CheR [Spongiibacteraceae bacterium]